MNKIYFINVWGNRKSAWSGTPDGLFTALSKKANVQEVNAVPSDISNRIVNLFQRLVDGVTCYLIKNRMIEKKIGENDQIISGNPIFAFGEYDTNKIADTYCYQDLSMDYLLRLRTQKHPAANFALNAKVPTIFARMKAKRANAFYKKCAGIFTMSEWLRQDLINALGISADRVYCVGGGSNIDVTKIDAIQKNGSRFLFVGKAWERKNGPLVVEAFKKLQTKFPDRQMELYIAGPEKKPDSVVNAKSIQFLGLQSHEALIEYYNLCDYFVMPSRFEAYGLVFAEALCFGLPCIGKNFCAMPEFIKDDETGYLIEHDDVDELADAMERMLLNGDRIKSNVRNLQSEMALKYSWDAVADRILNVIERDGYSVRK